MPLSLLDTGTHSLEVCLPVQETRLGEEGKEDRNKNTETDAGKEEPLYALDFGDLVPERKCSIDELTRLHVLYFVPSVEYCFYLCLNPQSSL